jgi:hypothetical protein
MTAATLVLLGGVALWQGWPALNWAHQEAAQASDGSGSAVAAPAAGGADRDRTTRMDPGPKVYVVATDAAAAELHATFEAFGPVDVRYQVLVFDSTEDGDRVLRLIGELAAYNDQAGLPPMVVVDLRSVGETAPPTAERWLTAPATHTLVVASPDDVTEAYAQFVERQRALDGSTPLAVTVLVGGEAPTVARDGTSNDRGATVGSAACHAAHPRRDRQA